MMRIRSAFEPSRAVLLGLTLTAFCISAVGFGSTASARIQPRSYEFDVVWSLFPELTLARGQFVMRDSRGGYLMGLEARAKVNTPRIDWRGALATEGERSGGARRPVRFERSSVRPNLEETIVVSWENDAGRPVTAVSRLPQGVIVERDAVDPNSVRDVVDPLTLLARVIDRVESTNGESCDVTATTWDGQRLTEVEIRTGERLESARIDCLIVYKRISGLRKDTPWRLREDTTLRVARFEKAGGEWQPKWIRIEADVIGMRTTFTTTIRLLER